MCIHRYLMKFFFLERKFWIRVAGALSSMEAISETNRETSDTAGQFIKTRGWYYLSKQFILGLS